MDVQQITSHPLKKLCDTWLEKVRLAKKDKRVKFQDDADEAMRFFDNTGDWLSLNAKRSAIRSDSPISPENVVAPSFEMRVNKVAEMRDLFGPAIYHTNPLVNVEPHDQAPVPPEALGIDSNAFMQMQQQMQTNPQFAMNPQMMMQFQMLQQQMNQYQQMQQQQQMDSTANRTGSDLIRRTLNYMQWETDKKTESRKALDEALIMGAGCLWHELTTSHEGTKLIGSYYDSIKRLFLDPDARVFADVKWMAQECVHPYWEVEDQFNLPRGLLKGKGTDESIEQEAELNNDPEANDKKANGKTNDLIRYYKIYSKMGMGSRLKNMKDGTKQPDELADQLEEFGDNCYLVVMTGIPYPLNLPWELIEKPMVSDKNGNDVFEFPKQIVTQQAPDPTNPLNPPRTVPVTDPQTGLPQTELRSDVFLAFQWPIPFWADDSWPCEIISFRWRPDEVWPMSIVKSGLGELRFINWVMSFLAVKTRRVCQTTVGVVKSAGEEIKKQLLSGADFNVIEIEQALGTRLEELVSFLQAPQFHPDIWTMLSQVFDLFDKRVGLTELIYGMTSNQLRTAEEANVKQQNMSIRPDDMANLAEDWMSKVARKEGMALRWLVAGHDVQPYLGPLGAMAWDKLVASHDLDTVTKEFRYRIEAGSMRKPNKSREIQDANAAMQAFGQTLWAYVQMTGNTAPFNVLLQKWAKANDVEMPQLPMIQQQAPPGQHPGQSPAQQQGQHPQQQPQHRAA